MAENPFRQELNQRGGDQPRKQSQGPDNPFRQEMESRPSFGEQVMSDIGSSAKSVAGGALDVIGMPADLINVPLEAMGAGRIPSGGQDLRQFASEYGITHEPGEEPQDLGHRFSRIVGSSVIPYGGMAGKGAQMARTGAQATGPISRAAQATAARPGTTFAAESASMAGAAAGGETGRAMFPDNEMAEVIGELTGGLSPAVATGIATSGPTGQIARKAGRGAQKAIFPFTERGGRVRASQRLRSAAADPDEAARLVSEPGTVEGAPLSPARKTGDKRLLSIERAVADEDPALDQRLTEGLSQATRRARDEATDFGGDASRTRELMENRREYLVNLVNKRAEQAGQSAQDAIENLDPNASPREISRVARGKIEGALDDAQKTETQLWNQIDKKAPASMASTRQTLQQELAQRSRFEDPEDIPAWLKGAAEETDGPVNFKDVHALRKRVGSEIAKERAQPAPNRNKVRILSGVYDSLLDDMATAEGQGEALDTALAYSRQMNQKFRQGAVGRLLGYERRGGLAVQPEDTLRRVISGEASGTQVRQVLEASPESASEMKDYLRSAYLVQTMEDGKFNSRAARRFLQKHEEVVDQFPDLKSELSDTREMNRLAARMGERQKNVQRLAYNAKKSRAALYLDSPIGEEWNRVLKAQNPAAVARSLKKRVAGDKKAMQGLKSSFIEELVKRSETRQFDEAGQPFVSGNRMKKLLDDYKDVQNAVGMTDSEKSRLRRVANTFSRIETQPQGREAIMDDRPAAFLDLMARWIGAQSGQRLAGTGQDAGMGSSMVMAQAFSQRMRNTLNKLTRDKAHQLISASVEDPKLFKDLMIGPDASIKRQEQAAQRINAWLMSPAAEESQEQPQQGLP